MTSKISLIVHRLMTLPAVVVFTCLLKLLKSENCTTDVVFQVMLQMLYLPAAWWRREWD